MTSTQPSLPPSPKGKTLLDTTDAAVWAAEFCRIFNGGTVGNPEGNVSSGHTYVDEGTMIAWFANAIETGRNAGRKETCSHNWMQLADDLYSCHNCGSVTAEPEEWDEPPTLEEKFVEGFQEGR